jgi:hypothetical protein
VIARTAGKYSLIAVIFDFFIAAPRAA